MVWKSDNEFIDYKIEKVRESGTGFEIGLSDSSGWIFATNENETTPPVVGETARLFGKGFGCTVRGIVVNGRCYRYETSAQERTRFDEELAAAKRERQELLDVERPARDKVRAAMPVEFQKRIAGFEERNADFRREHEPYEIFVCDQAIYIAATLKTGDEIERVGKLDSEPQREALPDLGGDHSGNTFGAAMRLAWLFVTSPENVERQHGAMCPLVGCGAYGCFAVAVA